MLAHGSHLTLLAETQAGYANLSRLIAVGQLAGTKGAPVLTIEDVAQHASGLLCLTGCRQGAVAQAVSADDQPRAVRAAGKLAEIFGRDRCWIELQRHWLPADDRLSAGLLVVAAAAGVGIVATNDVHYAAREGHRLHDALTATRHNVSLAELGLRQRPNSEFYLKGEAEMAALFTECPDGRPGRHGGYRRTVRRLVALHDNVELLCRWFEEQQLPDHQTWSVKSAAMVGVAPRLPCTVQKL